MPARAPTSRTPEEYLGDPLRRDALRITRKLSTAWLSLIRSLPGGSRLARATQLARLLRLSEKLGWQIWRTAHAASAVEVLEHLPGEHGIDIALGAAAKLGAPRRAVDA